MTGLVASWEEGDDPLSERAAEFFERRRFGEWSNDDQVELDAWLAESILHRAAYLRVEGIVAHTEHLVAFDPREFGLGGGGGNGFRKYRFPFLSAAALAFLAVVGVPLLNFLMQLPDHTFSTALGDHTLLKFADGTEVELNSDSAIRYRMTTGERTVWLEKGEAWFRVAHNAAHPFSVIAGNHRIADLGTEFLIRRDSDDVDVTLLNGRAALSTEGLQTATLSSGEEAIATPTALSITRKTPQELADELAWRQGMLVFRNTPLSEVVREFNRYNAIKLVIADPSIASKRVAVNIRADDYESFLRFAQDALKLHVEREGSVVLISHGPESVKKKAAHLKHSH